MVKGFIMFSVDTLLGSTVMAITSCVVAQQLHGANGHVVQKQVFIM
jgi:hypothetical protein